MDLLLRALGICALVAAMVTAHPVHADAIVQRDEVGILAGPYNLAFFDRHNEAYRTSAAVHYAHAKQHDVLQLTPRDRHAEWDARFNADVLAFLKGRPRIEPTMEAYGRTSDGPCGRLLVEVIVSSCLRRAAGPTGQFAQLLRVSTPVEF